MSKKNYVLAVLLLAGAMVLAACGPTSGPAVSGDSAATTEAGAAPDVPASDATVTGEAQGEPASADSGTSGAGDASGANAAGEASTATDVGSGSDGAAGSGGSDGASGATSPESDTGAPAAGDDTGNAASGTGGTADASGNTTDSSGNAGGEGGSTDPQAATTAVSYMAISDAECTEIQGQLTQALGIEVNRATGVASFTDLNGSTGESCRLTVAGTGANFESVPAVAALISQTLSDNGWAADNQYAAGGPTGTIGGLRRDNQLAAYQVEWSPASGVTCPADQPISVCAETLTPEQMDYAITVDLAQQ